VTVQVCDSGPPIPDDELAQIFSPEYPGRGDSWSTGLRLWFVRDALAALGGSVEVANGDAGVVCSVRIPAAVAPS
jgi:signal transduction histidine kinase